MAEIWLPYQQVQLLVSSVIQVNVSDCRPCTHRYSESLSQTGQQTYIHIFVH